MRSILDSYENETYYDGQAGAIYKQTPPLANAMRAPGQWNYYDVFWTAPRFNEDGSLKSPAYITAVHNGVLILNHFELKGDTPFNRPPKYEKHSEKGPLSLQDHGNPMRFRNIWVREIDRSKAVPGGRWLFGYQADAHNRLDTLEAILPRHDQTHWSTVLRRECFAIQAGCQYGERMHGFIQSQAFDIGPFENIAQLSRHAVNVEQCLKRYILGAGLRRYGLEHVR